MTLTQVARQVHLSQAYLSRLFKQRTGQSFIDYLTEVRLNEAKALLLAGEKTIDQIASAVGFNYNSYFTAVFKNGRGLPPRSSASAGEVTAPGFDRGDTLPAQGAFFRAVANRRNG